MCDPTLLIVSGVLGAVGAVQQGIASKNIANQNADIADQQRKNALAQGNLDAERAAKQGALQHGAQRAAAGASGRNTAYGTINALLGQTAGNILHDQKNIQLGAARQAFGYQVEANNYRAQGSQALTQGLLSAGQSLLGGVTGYMDAKSSWGAAGGQQLIDPSAPNNTVSSTVASYTSPVSRPRVSYAPLSTRTR